MSIVRYKISSLLSYQVEEIKKMVGGEVVVSPKKDAQFYYSAFVALTQCEVDILTGLGFCVTKHAAVGDGLII